MTKKLSRRHFLGQTGAGLLFCGGLGSVADLIAGCELHDEVLHISGRSRSFITPTDGELGNDFYIQFGGSLATPDNHPQIAEDDWEMDIRGAVDSDLTVTWADLMAAADTEATLFLKTMRCVFDAPGELLISNGYWRGVPLSHFLDQAGLSADATRLNITGTDGFTTNLRVARVMDNVSQGVSTDIPLVPIVLAYELNGSPIPTVHGGPVRLIAPEKSGFKNMKYPNLIEVSESDSTFGFYETTLFPGNSATDTGNIALTSLFTGPLEGETVGGPQVTLFGVAMIGPAEVESVELSVDGADFVPAQIISLDDVLDDVNLFFDGVTEDNVDSLTTELESVKEALLQVTDPDFSTLVSSVWSLWRFDANLQPGSHSARVRATGTGGIQQPETDREQGDGNTQIRRVSFTVA